ncbi:MAG: SDR family oxidoreductase [Nitrospira sp.]|nr:SDR family oxidoreductase [Nitrospira sp.]HNP29441.1 SDR family oxidoreductase [Nitrospirales bacterium]
MILLTGATGYVGGRLLGRLEQEGRQVRCLARRPEHLNARVGPGVEVVAGDVFDPDSLARGMRDVEAAYYLVHSMGTSGGFEEADRRAARNFGVAARAAGLKRIIYLGGLGDDRESLSPHLRSRHEVGEILRDSGVPVVEFRASIVLGSGSLSFEMIRTLVERLPVMLTPSWVRVPAQPIGIDDVLAYLYAALDVPLPESRIVEIGGDDVVSYGDLMQEYARQRGLRRLMIPVPILTPRLSSLWLGLVTPLYARVGRKLIQSIRYPTVVRDNSARRLFAIEPMGVHEAIARALSNEERELAASHWSDALSSSGDLRQYGGVRFGNRLLDVRTEQVSVPPTAAFRPIQRIGGHTGWYYANWLWRLRGWLDLLAGGVGLRRGRRDPEELRVGDVVDWWRVETIEPGTRLRLFAEMKLPGRAWLEFLVEPHGAGSKITQTASFDPIGLSGLVYWYGVWPLHELVFRGMIRGIAREAQRQN